MCFCFLMSTPKFCILKSNSGPIRCHILAKDNAISDWRKLMGATKVFKYLVFVFFYNDVSIILTSKELFMKIQPLFVANLELLTLGMLLMDQVNYKL